MEHLIKYNLGWCYNVNRDIGAMIDQMFDGKSSKEGKSFHYRGRRARPSADEAEAMRAAAREESLDYVDYNSTIVRSNFKPPISPAVFLKQKISYFVRNH